MPEPLSASFMVILKLFFSFCKACLSSLFTIEHILLVLLEVESDLTKLTAESKVPLRLA